MSVLCREYISSYIQFSFLDLATVKTLRLKFGRVQQQARNERGVWGSLATAVSE
jgi:hypothetical protein